MKDSTPRRQLFKATSTRSETSTGIGILRHDPITYETLQIFSLYYNTRYSNRDMFSEICKIVRGEIAEEEQAHVEYAGGRFKRQWKYPYRPQILIIGKKHNTHRFGEVMALAGDALVRKSSIITDI